MIAGSINTNVAERSRFFGMLRCTGASKAQIKRFVRFEALNWCKTAIPVGVILGIVITWGLCGILRVVSSEFSYIPVFGGKRYRNCMRNHCRNFNRIDCRTVAGKPCRKGFTDCCGIRQRRK